MGNISAIQMQVKLFQGAERQDRNKGSIDKSKFKDWSLWWK
jgi:hypothetical protein